jgi:hypothetical protein
LTNLIDFLGLPIVPGASEATGVGATLCAAEALPELRTLLSAASGFEADAGIDGPSAGAFFVTVA